MQYYLEKYKSFFKYLETIKKKFRLIYKIDENNNQIIVKSNTRKMIFSYSNDFLQDYDNDSNYGGPFPTITLDNIRLPNNLKIMHFPIKITNYPDEVLPDNLSVMTVLDISNTKIKKFGKNTYIEGYLQAAGSSLEQLEQDLELARGMNISYTNINEIPISLFKNGRYLNFQLNGLFIKNMDELFNKDINDNFYVSYTSYIYENKEFFTRIVYISELSQEFSFDTIDSLSEFIFDKIPYIKIPMCMENMKKTILSYNIVLPIQKKLLLEEFDKITYEEIKENIQNNNSRVKKYEYKHIYNLIYYCRSKKAMNFLKKNNYIFTEKEYKTLLDPNIKALYANFLIN